MALDLSPAVVPRNGERPNYQTADDPTNVLLDGVQHLYVIVRNTSGSTQGFSISPDQEPLEQTSLVSSSLSYSLNDGQYFFLPIDSYYSRDAIDESTSPMQLVFTGADLTNLQIVSYYIKR